MTETEKIDAFARAIPGLSEQFTISSDSGHLLATRLVEVLDRVKEHESYIVSMRREFDKAVQLHSDAIDRVKELEIKINREQDFADSYIRRLNHSEALVEKLQADQTPRPMIEAPRDGTEIAMIVPVRYRNHVIGSNVRDDDFFDREGDPHSYSDGWVLGWLPLPDQGKDSP